MKRPLPPEDAPDDIPRLKKRNVASNHVNVESYFRKGLFTTSSFYRAAYESSQPYPHGVLPSLLSPSLLQSVRNEIKTHISFTLKETDIYRIHQSGDLANLSNLDSESLSHLPSLLKLRDALYSPQFRAYLSEITGAGKLSGKKTDMAVNVYTPGSYLLCHDDVIGSRRVSYILYLTDPDPDKAWRPEWGGGLRLYPTEFRRNKNGEDVKVPLPEHSVNIPPSFGQLSFFAVRPGESFHDVEEVYYPSPGSAEEEGSRIRIAISGWYHIPQEGEDGFEKGVEEHQAQKSSLAQLEGNAHEFDEPRIEFEHFDEPREVTARDADAKEIDPGEDSDTDSEILTEQDLTFLLEYIAPSYLTPDMTETLCSSFEENSFLQLDGFVCSSFSKRLKEHIEYHDFAQSASSITIGHKNGSSERTECWPKEDWQIARPPHKHRFAYLQCPRQTPPVRSMSPVRALLVDLLRSHAFKKWLALITGLKSTSLPRQNVLARRFRRGKDYILASGYQGQEPRLEFTLGLTPTEGWGDANDDKEDMEGAGAAARAQEEHNDQPPLITTSNGFVKINQSTSIDVGGEEVYMAGDEEDDSASANSKSRPDKERRKADPAVYRSAHNDEDEDSILFTDEPAWNRFSVVLRDRSTLRFVKYVTQAARGDRWDIKGEVEVEAGAWGNDGDEQGNEGESEGVVFEEEDGSDEGSDEDIEEEGEDYDEEDDDD